VDELEKLENLEMLIKIHQDASRKIVSKVSATKRFLSVHNLLKTTAILPNYEEILNPIDAGNLTGIYHILVERFK
jgi:hypothetical protein